jgi:hypothetical protein
MMISFEIAAECGSVKPQRPTQSHETSCGSELARGHPLEDDEGADTDWRHIPRSYSYEVYLLASSSLIHSGPACLKSRHLASTSSAIHLCKMTLPPHLQSFTLLHLHHGQSNASSFTFKWGPCSFTSLNFCPISWSQARDRLLNSPFPITDSFTAGIPPISV